MISSDTTSFHDRKADWSIIPEHMHEGVVLYVMHGIKPGSFMVALLANDLMEAMGRADTENRYAMPGWATFLYCHVPMNCRGSYTAVKDWCESGGLNGQRTGAAR